MTLITTAPFIHSIWIFVRRFGALAFFPLGLLDMSFLAPGSFDALLIVLTLAHKELWWYYALMATAGSIFGTWPSFHLGRKGGEEALDKRLGPLRSKKIFAAFQRWGFFAMFIGAAAPPPTPASAFILAAGALRYPYLDFLFAWTCGRLFRFGLVAWVTMRYGGSIFQWLRGYYKPALLTLAALILIGVTAALWFYLRARRNRSSENGPQRRAA